MKNKIIKCFNQGVKTYDQAAAVQLHVANALATRIKNISANKILEIGCGTGVFSEKLILAFPTAHFLLTDITPNMVAECQQRFKQYPQVNYLCLDGENIADLSQKYDLIVSNMTLQWFENIPASLEKIIAQLAPNGKLIFSLLGEKSLHEWQHMCGEFDITAGLKKFPQQSVLKDRCNDLHLENELFQFSYQSAHGFLRSLKNLGATATDTQYIFTSVGKLRRLFRAYSDEVKMTYDIIYGCYTKK